MSDHLESAEQRTIYLRQNHQRAVDSVLNVVKASYHDKFDRALSNQKVQDVEGKVSNLLVSLYRLMV